MVRRLGLRELIGDYLNQEIEIEEISKIIIEGEIYQSEGDVRSLTNILKLLMLHPLWSEIEEVSSLIGELIKKDKVGFDIIYALMKEDNVPWGIKYGAVDAAYNAGEIDEYKTFQEVFKIGAKDQNCRVRGICADDLLGWLRQDSISANKRKKIILDPEIREILKFWMERKDNEKWG